MLGDVTAGLVLLAITVIVHAAGMTALLKWLMRPGALVEERFWGTTWLVVRTAWYLIAIHLVEITVWAMFYWEQRCLPDLQSAVYLRRHLHHRRLRRPRVAEAMAAPWAPGGAHRHPDVRALHRIFLCVGVQTVCRKNETSPVST